MSVRSGSTNKLGKKAVYSAVDLSKKKRDRELKGKDVKDGECSNLEEKTSKIDATNDAKEPAKDKEVIVVSSEAVPSAAAAADAVENGVKIKKKPHKYEEIDGVESQPAPHHNYEDVDEDDLSPHNASPTGQQAAKPPSGAPKVGYTLISADTLESNINPTSTRYEDTNISTTTAKELTPVPQTRRKKSLSHSKFVCIVCSAMAVFIIFVGMCVCLGIIYIEVRRLRSELASLNMPGDDSAETGFLASMDEQGCPVETCEAIEKALNATVTLERFEKLEELTDHVLITISSLGQPSTPAASCAALLQFHPSSPSGYYWVRASNGSAMRVYCDMTLSCGNVTGGWTRVAHLNITSNSSTQCPPTLSLRDPPLCSIESSSVIICSSTLFNSSDVLYSSVCGRVTAYQGGSPQAFHPENDIDSPYVAGISLTHGSPRQHIWTFAAASNETHNNCPCSNSSESDIPSFVGSDYFCDGIDPDTTHGLFELYSPLWDGSDCSPTNRCCSFNNPPWFYRHLPQATTDNIEMRVCRNEARANVGIEALELYVQ